MTRQTEILEQIARGVALPGLLAGIARTLEELVPGSYCSVLLLDTNRTTLHHGAAPSLPAGFADAIDGLAVGAEAGSCGTAVFFGIPVVVADIRVDARWTRFRDLAARFGLQACWSTPIDGRAGITGTFAVYHRVPHRPSLREVQLVARLSHLTSVAIDFDAAEKERRGRVEAEMARQAAEAASRAKSDFVASLGHELRTPLQAIKGFSELLRTLNLDGVRRTEALNHIDAAAGHILAMVDDLLDIARVEANALSLDITDVSLEPMVAEVLAMTRTLAVARHVTVSSTAPIIRAFVRADERRIRQVLLNLVGNAIRHNRPGGDVLVECTAHVGTVRIVVRDTGPGIPVADLHRLFTPFDRLGAESKEGVGLGLPLAKGLVEAMGGSLEMSSVVGSGTAATVTLPLGEPIHPPDYR
ncbi:sensor histidine kinase [Mycobacterium sp. NPDC003449]